MRRLLIGLFLVLHGLGHAAVGMSAQDAAPRHVAPLTAELRVGVATVLFTVAMVGFIAGGLRQWGVLRLGRGWLGAVRAAVFASVMLLAVFERSLSAIAVGLLLDGLAFTTTLGEEPVGTQARKARGSTWALRVARLSGVAVLAYLTVVALARPWHRTWGSTSEERAKALPGDEHAGNAERAGDRSIAIDAPPEDVWPWLLQLGQDRGGFYSYEALERLFGIHIRNTDVVVPAWQTIAPGDFVRATQPEWMGGVFGDRIGWEVDHVAANRILALRYWIFEIEALPDGTSRLHVRTHAGAPPAVIAPMLLLVFEPAHFIMERAMLQGIRDRAEAMPHRDAGSARPNLSMGSEEARHDPFARNCGPERVNAFETASARIL